MNFWYLGPLALLAYGAGRVARDDLAAALAIAVLLVVGGVGGVLRLFACASFDVGLDGLVTLIAGSAVGALLVLAGIVIGLDALDAILTRRSDARNGRKGGA